MGSFRSFRFLLILYLLKGTLSNSLIQLNNNGYEGIVVAIDPNVPENETLIQHIKVSVGWQLPIYFGNGKHHCKTRAMKKRCFFFV